MDNNISYSRIYTTPDFSLVIKSFSIADAGIYRCHGEEGQKDENKYNYRIERKIDNNYNNLLTINNLYVKNFF